MISNHRERFKSIKNFGKLTNDHFKEDQIIKNVYLSKKLSEMPIVSRTILLNARNF